MSETETSLYGWLSLQFPNLLKSEYTFFTSSDIKFRKICEFTLAMMEYHLKIKCNYVCSCLDDVTYLLFKRGDFFHLY